MDELEGSGSGSGWCVNCGNRSEWEDWERLSLFGDTVLVVVTTVCVPLLLLGLLGNALTILVVWRRPQMRSTTYLYLSSMAVSDVLILLLMPLDLYKLWRYRPWLLGDAVCKLSVFVGECCTFSSILHMTALGAERYLAVCFPLRARLLVTRRRVRVLIAGLWGVAMLSAGPALALVGVEQLEAGASECRCTQYAQTSGLLKAMLWLSNLYFICPLTILTLLYGLIARRLHLRAHTHRDKTHHQTLRMMVVIVLVFILCWLPFHVSRTLFSVSDSSDLYYISQYFNLVSLVLFYVSAAVNPLLYNIMSARYRANVLAMLRSIVGSTDEQRQRARTSPLTASHSSTHF
ncbi:growth hormone secretagogue receptor type 1-like [Ctenopharyngodon idella]|uniref:growth hormone secretagogue receptor type 1-like n=1 Tax=Ctenopharyngodon idella TaxID=7959 RepID=UPI00222F6EF2|nr:growth hormone secretagogue receptor type 1-like [Ctenopharyngodon idella]